MTRRTWQQTDRQKARGRDGRYGKLNPCESCGKSAGANYHSDGRQSGTLGAYGLVLCGRCATKIEAMDDGVALAHLKAAGGSR